MIEISVIEDITLSKSNDKRYVIIDKVSFLPKY